MTVETVGSMTSSNKWLIGMGGALGVLVLIAVVAAVLLVVASPNVPRPVVTPPAGPGSGGVPSR